MGEGMQMYFVDANLGKFLGDALPNFFGMLGDEKPAKATPGNGQTMVPTKRNTVVGRIKQNTIGRSKLSSRARKLTGLMDGYSERKLSVRKTSVIASIRKSSRRATSNGQKMLLELTRHGQSSAKRIKVQPASAIDETPDKHDPSSPSRKQGRLKYVVPCDQNQCMCSQAQAIQHPFSRSAHKSQLYVSTSLRKSSLRFLFTCPSHHPSCVLLLPP